MSESIRSIVAGVSEPADDDPALLAALEVAHWSGATLHLVHTLDTPDVFSPLEVGYAAGEWASRFADEQRPRMEAVVRRLAPALRTVCSAGVGPPAAAILEAARTAAAELIVVGAARGGRMGGALLGTTAERVLREAAVPVLVVRRPVLRPLSRVLVATDLSASAHAVHARGADAVHAIFGDPGAVRALHVPPRLPIGVPVPREAGHAGADEAMRRFLEAMPRGGSAIEPVVRPGDAAEEIVREAKAWGADLLVVGTHGRGWAERMMMLGSVAVAALRHAPCNVLAIPPAAAGAPDVVPQIRDAAR